VSNKIVSFDVKENLNHYTDTTELIRMAMGVGLGALTYVVVPSFIGNAQEGKQLSGWKAWSVGLGAGVAAGIVTGNPYAGVATAGGSLVHLIQRKGQKEFFRAASRPFWRLDEEGYDEVPVYLTEETEPVSDQYTEFDQYYNNAYSTPALPPSYNEAPYEQREFPDGSTGMIQASQNTFPENVAEDYQEDAMRSNLNDFIFNGEPIIETQDFSSWIPNPR
jgi:hypothetical protein